MLRYAGHWLLLGFGYWVVEEKSTGTFLGEVGFSDLKRKIDPPLGSIPEAGWVFATLAHGKGFASEAVEAIHIWGRSHLQTAVTACLIHPENAPSLRLAANIGYRETAQGTYKGQRAIILHRILADR
jgi:RimJ/RimL family protein N-acetyltransferase